jgi:hypothetical protein
VSNAKPNTKLAETPLVDVFLPEQIKKTFGPTRLNKYVGPPQNSYIEGINKDHIGFLCVTWKKTVNPVQGVSINSASTGTSKGNVE